VSKRFEELDWRKTRLGEISLRRRWDLTFGQDVYEVKLDDEFLMSSLFTVAEIELARCALSPLDGDGLSVVVGGLGLGYTACEVLESPRVGSLVVVEALDTVIDWHQQGLLPNGRILNTDSRCRYVNGDFFSMATSPAGFDPATPGRKFDAVIVDIDHSPRHLLHSSHAEFYERPAEQLAAHLAGGGVFALWSNDPPDKGYMALLSQVLDGVEAKIVSFYNRLQDRESTNTVYIGRKPSASIDP
jgi:spermidine synthase